MAPTHRSGKEMLLYLKMNQFCITRFLAYAASTWFSMVFGLVKLLAKMISQDQETPWLLVRNSSINFTFRPKHISQASFVRRHFAIAWKIKLFQFFKRKQTNLKTLLMLSFVIKTNSWNFHKCVSMCKIKTN